MYYKRTFGAVPAGRHGYVTANIWVKFLSYLGQMTPNLISVIILPDSFGRFPSDSVSGQNWPMYSYSVLVTYDDYHVSWFD